MFPLKKAKLTQSEFLTLIATGVMTLATVVMMYSGCQQTRIAVSMEALAKQDEFTKLMGAKRQLQKVFLAVLSEYEMTGPVWKLRTKEDCARFAKRIAELMDVPDNYYLFKHPSEARLWYETRSQLVGAYAAPRFFDDDHPIVESNRVVLSTQLSEAEAVKWLQEAGLRCSTNLFRLHGALQLGEEVGGKK